MHRSPFPHLGKGGTLRVYSQGRSQDFSKGRGVHIVSKWGYSPDYHVIFATCCRLFALKSLQGVGGGGHGHPRSPLVKCCSRAPHNNPGQGSNPHRTESSALTMRPPYPPLLHSMPWCSYLVLCFPKGKSINIAWTVKNYGMGVTAYGSWYDRVYLSKDDKRGWFLPDYIYITSEYMNNHIFELQRKTSEDMIDIVRWSNIWNTVFLNIYDH